MPGQGLPRALQAYYGRLLGELSWIEAPPKTMNRRSRRRDEFEASEPERLARAERIRDDLPHVLHVIRMLEPEWQPEAAKAVRPSKGWKQAPPGGWIGAARRVLQEAEAFLTIADIVEEVAAIYDIDISDVADRQALHTAINNSLMRRRDILVSDGGSPAAWALASKVNDFNASAFASL